ncbi:hypothetical protein [Mesorhizobium sanjuanii]|uniref:hypothetical protein n=1 Tax=Mesorhizobium sanjuanii TaxID=2037900 RepID=UPI0013FDD608|nr:hypothetical protein [Mesorhizobium sanjuanii]
MPDKIRRGQSETEKKDTASLVHPSIDVFFWGPLRLVDGNEQVAPLSDLITSKRERLV